MLDITRRGFMNLLGVLGVVASTEKALSIPLFGSDDASGLIVPDASMVSGHFVVYPKTLTERIGKEEAAEIMAKRQGPGFPLSITDHYIPVARMTRNRTPEKPIVTRQGSFNVTPQLADGVLVQDAHTAFYLASKDIHSRFAAFTRETLLEVPWAMRSAASIVTIADTPIHARPAGLRSNDNFGGRHLLEPSIGFDVVCEFRQFAVIGMPRREIDTFRIYSEQGEFPLIVPRDVDMGLLIKMDTEVLSEKPRDNPALTRLLAGISNWKV